MPGLQQTPALALHQTLGPQMQQSLAILQAPLLELQSMVRQEVEANPVLEEVPPAADEGGTAEGDPQLEALSALAEEWREYYAQARAAAGTDPDAEARHQYALDSATAPPTLREHLESQVADLGLSEDRARCVRFLIASLDESGYLTSPLEELAAVAGTGVAEMEEALRALRSLDPPGVGARDLAECLTLQLEAQGLRGSIEAEIVSRHLDALARRRYSDIARALGVTVERVAGVAARIARLDPRPGSRFEPGPTLVVLPDLTIERVGEEFVVSANDRDLPHLRIGENYKDLMAAGVDAATQKYLREKIRGGRFLIRCIHQRQQTLLAIGRELAARQREFLERGPAHLKPMTMAQIAEAIGVHETTVSRAISGKYVRTPSGVFELRSFFTSGYQTASGESLSNTSVMEAIQELIRNEDPRHPLSDQEIIATLSERGIPIARRTVAKYRSKLGILPSHLRRTG